LLDRAIRSGRGHTDARTASTSNACAGPNSTPACAHAETKARSGRDPGTERHPYRDSDTEPVANRHSAAHANGGERASERGTITLRGVHAEPARLAVELSHSGCCPDFWQPERP
jgi:hypothetical protein